MLATRTILKTVAQNPATRAALFKNTAATSVGVRHFNASRPAAEQSPAAESELLRQQRKHRPISPHLTIYQPQITWYMSGAHRITGVALGGAFYLGALAYLAGPAFGYSIESASLIASAAAAPAALKIAAKTTVAFPFVYHCLNGVRHLLWDTVKFADIKGVYKTGYVVLGSTLVGSLYLASL